jgi:hypothetical protein
MKILSIDAMNDGGVWDWNQRYHIGNISKEEFECLESDEDFIEFFYQGGYINEDSKTKVLIEDDEYNIVLKVAEDLRPLYAIEYGNEY